MGWSESELVCKKHQIQNKNLQGVCPICLGERLSQLSSSATWMNKAAAAMVAPSSSSSLSSSPVSSSNNMSSSPGRHHHRNVSETMGSISLTLSAAGGNNGLKKSRTIAFVPKNFVEDNNKNVKKKKGFWSKLLHLEGKKEILTHSRTLREG